MYRSFIYEHKCLLCFGMIAFVHDLLCASGYLMYKQILFIAQPTMASSFLIYIALESRRISVKFHVAFAHGDILNKSDI